MYQEGHAAGQSAHTPGRCKSGGAICLLSSYQQKPSRGTGSLASGEMLSRWASLPAAHYKMLRKQYHPARSEAKGPRSRQKRCWALAAAAMPVLWPISILAAGIVFARGLARGECSINEGRDERAGGEIVRQGASKRANGGTQAKERIAHHRVENAQSHGRQGLGRNERANGLCEVAMNAAAYTWEAAYDAMVRCENGRWLSI